MTFDPALTISNLPLSPGVYRFYGAGDLLLYIGKAKRLKNRVSSYFSPTKLAQNPRLQLMVSQIEKIEYTVVKTEHESIILEANLIHSLQPKFNILLKDDRSYLYVRISGGNEIVGSQTKFILKEWQVEKHTNKIITFEPNSQRTQNPETNFVQTSFSDGKFLDAKDLIPTVSLTRRKYDKKSDYFGPYTKRYGIFNVLRVIRTIFPYCEKKVYDNKPCSYVQLKQCDGICCGLETIAEYNGRLNQIKKVLKGDSAEVKNWLKNKITEAINLSNYELAGLWRDRVQLLDEVLANQKIIFPHPQDLDIHTLVLEKGRDGFVLGSVFVQNIREGKIINLNNFLLSGTGELEDGDVAKLEIESSLELTEDTVKEIANPDQKKEGNTDQISRNLLPENKNQEQILTPISSTETFDIWKNYLTAYYAENIDRPEVLLQSYSFFN